MMIKRTKLSAILAAAFVTTGASIASAGGADVIDVKITKQGQSFSFDVTLKHADTGWKHYANKWDVVGPDGKVLGTRVLYHPHVEEQPFTRSLSGVKIPAGVSQVTVRGYDSKHGLGGKTMQVAVPH